MEQPRRSRAARVIRSLAVPIMLGWLAVTVLTNVAAPQLEIVGKANSVSMNAQDAPALQAMQRIGRLFGEFDSDSSAMVLLEAQQPLDDSAHAYYANLMRELRQDSKHVRSIQDFWGDPLTAAGAQSPDGKAAYVQVYLAGNQGESLANESIEAVRAIVSRNTAPPGVAVYVTGGTALSTDLQGAGESGMLKTTLLTFAIIIGMLLWVYRSVVSVAIVLGMVLFELAAARGVVAMLGHTGVIGLSTYATSLLTALVIAAGTDYAIFLVGRYQEARQFGDDRESAYYAMFDGVGHVILASGVTVAGATFCLSFTRLPYFQTLGVPCSIALLVTVLAAVSLGPAVITVAGRFGVFEPKRLSRVRGWRKIGTVIVRWPGPVLVATCLIVAIGLAALPGHKTSYDDRQYVPTNIPAMKGFEASDRHFSKAKMNQEILLVETDHDMRNSGDMVVLDKIARSLFRVRGIARVQSITRPQGTAMEHTSIPFQISMQNIGQQQTQKYMRDRMAEMGRMANDMGVMIDSMKSMLKLMDEMSGIMGSMNGSMKTMQSDINDMRDKIANFDDQFRPIRNYFYWEPHCFDIPMCWSIRSIFDVMDGIDTMAENMAVMMTSMDKINAIMPQMAASMKPMLAQMEVMRSNMLAMSATMNGIQDQSAEMNTNSTAMGQAYDASKNDDSFYLPPEIFENPEFKRGLKMFLTPDGKAVRMYIQHDGNPASPEGISRIDEIKTVAKEAVKGSPLEGARIAVGGSAATYKDMQDGSSMDLLIAVVSALCLIMIIMLLTTRSLVAAAVIVSTVAISLGTSLGLAVLLWQYVLGLELHWMVVTMSVIILLAVGSDYNLLLVSRLKEEIGAGLKTGIIRAMGGTGSVVTAAGLVFAFTMASMAISDLQIMAQAGTTIGLGLLVDTLVVRAFMTPSIAALLGRWFWWPINTLRLTGARQSNLPEMRRK